MPWVRLWNAVVVLVSFDLAGFRWVVFRNTWRGFCKKRCLVLCPCTCQITDIICLKVDVYLLKKKIMPPKQMTTIEQRHLSVTLPNSVTRVSLHPQLSTKRHPGHSCAAPFLQGSAVPWHREWHHLCGGAALTESAGGQDHHPRGRAAAVSEQTRGGIPLADTSFVQVPPQIMCWGLTVVLSIVHICLTLMEVTFNPGVC